MSKIQKEAASVDVEFEKGLSQPGSEKQVIQQEAERKQGLESYQWAFQKAPCKAAWPFFQITPHAMSSYCSKSTLSLSRGETHGTGSHAGVCLIKHSNIYRENYSAADINIFIQRIDFLFCPNELALDEKHSPSITRTIDCEVKEQTLLWNSHSDKKIGDYLTQYMIFITNYH